MNLILLNIIAYILRSLLLDVVQPLNKNLFARYIVMIIINIIWIIFLAPHDIGFKDIYEDTSDSKKEFESNLKKVFGSFSTKYYPKLYNYTFRMAFPYKRFRLILE